MVELGWHSNATYSIQPSNNEEVNWNVIGVADYDISDSSCTLSLEIKNRSTAGVHPYFLTYNKAKGIHEDTHSGPNEVIIVQGVPGEQSSLIASISQGSSFPIPNYYNGRSLDITVEAGVVDGGVNFVPVTVSQETISCTVDNDCIGNLSTCNTSTCIDDTCVHSLLPDCCGNDICETTSGEYGFTCPTDCASPTELDGRSDNYVGGSSSSAAYGIKFNADAVSDISFYEIEVDLYLGVTEGANIAAKKYRKVGALRAQLRRGNLSSMVLRHQPIQNHNAFHCSPNFTSRIN